MGEDDLKGLFEPTDGQPADFMTNFGMVTPTGKIPIGNRTVKKKFWIRVRVLYPNWMNWLLRPLCRIGWHRWKPTHKFLAYEPVDTFDADFTGKFKATIQQWYKCTRCKEKKQGPIL